MRKYFWWLAAVLWAVLILYLTSIPNLSVVEDTLLSLLFTSFAHFLFFGIEAVLIYQALSAASTIWPVILTSAYGIFDELHQLIVPGRSATFADWALDTAGAVLFIYFFLKYRSKKAYK